MTSAEARNADATVAEFRERLGDVCNDAEEAGLTPEGIGRDLILTGIYNALQNGIPEQGLFNIDDYLAHLLRYAKEEARTGFGRLSPQPDSNPSSPASASSGSPADAAETAPGSREPDRSI